MDLTVLAGRIHAELGSGVNFVRVERTAKGRLGVCIETSRLEIAGRDHMRQQCVQLAREDCDVRFTTAAAEGWRPK